MNGFCLSFRGLFGFGEWAAFLPVGRPISLVAKLLQNERALSIEQSLQPPSIGQSPFEKRNQGSRNIHAATCALLAKGEDVGRVLGSLGTLGTSGSNARFIDFGQGAFEGGPESVPVLGRGPREGRVHQKRLTDIFSRDKYVLYYIYIHALATPSSLGPS